MILNYILGEQLISAPIVGLGLHELSLISDHNADIRLLFNLF